MKRSTLRKVSKRLSAALRKYDKAKKEFLADHPSCEVCCRFIMTQIHHKAGRSGDLLYNTDYFLSVCKECHSFIHNNPKWAYEKGYSVDRLSTSSYE